MRNCRILGSKSGRKIYRTLSTVLPFLNYPVKEDVQSPLLYIDSIMNGDIILLDNIFPGIYWEESLGDKFLEGYLAKGTNAKIICISDYGYPLVDKYRFRNETYKKGDIIGRFSEKDTKKLAKFLKEYIKTLETY